MPTNHIHNLVHLATDQVSLRRIDPHERREQMSTSEITIDPFKHSPSTSTGKDLHTNKKEKKATEQGTPDSRKNFDCVVDVRVDM